MRKVEKAVHEVQKEENRRQNKKEVFEIRFHGLCVSAVVMALRMHEVRVPKIVEFVGIGG